VRVCVAMRVAFAQCVCVAASEGGCVFDDASHALL